MSHSVDPIKKLEHADALSPTPYVDPRFYQHDLNHIIAANWQCIAPASSASDVGDVISRDIAGVPIMVVRGRDQSLNGFYNICLHRAGPVADCDKKGLSRLRCAYHGWSYDLDGQLIFAPEMKEAESFNTNDKRLKRIEVVEWGNMIFARLDGHNGPTFDELYGTIETKLPLGSLNNLRHHSSQLYSVNCNWKVYIDNFLEGYHLPFVHPGLSQAVSYSDYHTELAQWWSLQQTPIEEETQAYGTGHGYYFYVYPNVMLNIMPGRMQSNRVVPTGIDSCEIEFEFYYTPEAQERAVEDQVFSEQIQEEDRIICEHVQKGLTSGVYSPGRLSPKRESGVWHFQNLLRREYRLAGFTEYR
ncbi:carnitine monooxygenase subunit YeaW [Arenicella sp. 4NH20-0111]|uniref:aromatic ring-hydroxylating oxygenase subunit alpha n=1 Tax=Arenicella sp. 4NH20-0111 TaxID=3127648 RepID=UPI003102A033